MFYTIFISVVQTHTHAKRHTNPLKIWRCIIDVNFERVTSHCSQRLRFKSSKICVNLIVRVLSNIKFNTDTLRFVYTNFWRLTFIKKRWYLRCVDVSEPLHEQEILLRPCRNFASVKEGFIECLDLAPRQNYASDVTMWRCSRFQGKMTIPGYQFRDSLQCLQRKMRK